MGIISFESFTLVCIFVALGAYLVWQQVKEAGRNIEATLDHSEEYAVSGQAKEDEAQRRRMVHEADCPYCADMEPFCGGSDSHARSRAAVARAQEAARDSVARKP